MVDFSNCFLNSCSGLKKRRLNVTQTVDTEEIRRKLLAWYNEEKRDLPWRRISDPYAIWVSEVMLQQTQTVKVLDYFSRFIARFPTVTSLAAAESDEVLKMWEGLGYYARARNLHKAAQYIVEHLGGRIPDTREALQKIPGIGAYTAAAVASIAFGEPCAVVDGNVIRVLSRLFAFAESPRSTGAKKFFQHKADELLAPDSPGDFNQALMELGATLCTPRKPGCLLCPLQKACAALHTLDDPSVLPVKSRQKERPHYHVAVGLIWDEGELFIDKRPENGMLGGMWEFPGGKIETGENAREAVKREIREELDIEVEVGDFFMEVKHAYTHFRITLYAYHCLYLGGEPRLDAAEDWRWVRPRELRFFPFAAASKKIIDKLEREFAGDPYGRERNTGSG